MNKGNEIFGWLVGAENKKKDTLYVECAISSHRYLTQNVIAAEPDLTETAIISSVLPAGLGIIGMYHSHPVNIFHSSTDNRTLSQLVSLYTNSLSIVTNGDDLKVYQMEKGSNSLLTIEKNYIRKEDKHSKFKSVTFEFTGKIRGSIPDLSVNDIITSIEKAVRERFEKTIYENELKKILGSRNKVIKVDMKRIAMIDDLKSGNTVNDLVFHFTTVLDVSEDIFGDKKKSHQMIINSLLRDILLQLRHLKINSSALETVIPTRRVILFQDIPLHVYLDDGNEKSPMNQFNEDMEFRSEIMNKINK
jgi:proteasome lid subunit RPN8/RPN11